MTHAPTLPLTLRFVLIDSHQTLEVATHKRSIIVGRSNHHDNVDIDLVPYGGYRMGVSRQHLKITISSEGVQLVDLDSRHGSFINGQRMVAGEYYTLRHDDEVQLGTMQLRLELS